jgi:hypothetical protein
MLVAACARRKAGQKNRPGDNARRQDPWVLCLEHRLHRVKRRRVDDWIDGNANLIGFRFCLSGFPDLAVEAMLALVGRAREDLVQRADAPSCADPRAVPVLIQPARDGLHAHWASSPVALAEELEHQTDDLGPDRINGEAFFGFCAALLDINHGVTIRSFRVVPEALLGIILHGAECVLSVLIRKQKGPSGPIATSGHSAKIRSNPPFSESVRTGLWQGCGAREGFLFEGWTGARLLLIL